MIEYYSEASPYWTNYARYISYLLGRVCSDGTGVHYVRSSLHYLWIVQSFEPIGLYGVKHVLAVPLPPQ